MSEVADVSACAGPVHVPVVVVHVLVPDIMDRAFQPR